MNQPILELCSDFRSLTDAMNHWSERESDRTVLTFVTGESVTSLDYGTLHRRALEISGELLSRCAPGDRVILGFEQGLDYVAGFLACVYAGTVAVTSAPPTELRRSTRLARLIEDSGAAAILTNDIAQEAFAPVKSVIALVNSDHMTAAALEEPCAVRADDLMFLQYTSGSTSAPKGVMLTHGSIAANLHAILADTSPDDDSVYVSWLPLYHDMGLIFMTLAPLFAGRPIYLMSPVEFLRYPERWLQAISTWRGTITAAPNFAYRLCCDRVRGRKKQALDLSSMRQFINGSEPIRTEDMETFVEAFAETGLRPEAMTGGYGMAEVGVYACLGPAFVTDTSFNAQRLADKGRADPVPSGNGTRRLAACGRANTNHFDLRIVNPDTAAECPERSTGEVWISGPSVGKGYWRNTEATQASFGARLADGTAGLGGGGYLRTGDIGFVHDGQLFICGRSKEMMILRGRNVFPADVCETIELIGPAMRGRRAAAFTIPGDPDEKLVIVCAARATNSDACQTVVRQIMAAVSDELGIVPHDIVIVPNRALERTTSGKVQHGALRKAYLQDTIEAEFSQLRGATGLAEATAEPPEPTNTEVPEWVIAKICGYVANVSGQDTAHADGDLFELGFDSLRGVRLIERIETGLLNAPSHLSLADLSRLRTPRNIAAALGARAARNNSVKELVL